MGEVKRMPEGILVKYNRSNFDSLSVSLSLTLSVCMCVNVSLSNLYQGPVCERERDSSYMCTFIYITHIYIYT